MSWDVSSIPPLVSPLVLALIVCVLWLVRFPVRRLGLLPALVAAGLSIYLVPLDCVNAFAAVLPDIAVAVAADLRLYGFLSAHLSMLIAGSASLWLAHRAFQTLCMPVSELVRILGIEVPTAPDVSLTAIGVDKATITWTRPPPNRSVAKYVIQVNGVNVGESTTSQDTFITVSGLKPDHFYNVRIIAVSQNNFQTGSRVLRLRTFGADGRPRLGTNRLPSDFTEDDAASASRQHDATATDDNGQPVRHLITSTFGVAQPLPPDDPPVPYRESNSSIGLAPSTRRNTVNRRHSPSSVSLDQLQLQRRRQSNPAPPTAPGGCDDSDVTEEQMAELNQRYLNLRKETEDVMASNAKEEEEMRKLMEELDAEKQAKRKEHKRKEEQTEKLKREQGATERSMRAAIQRRTQKEKKLKEKMDERKRLEDSIKKWDASIKDMKEEQHKFDEQKKELEEYLQAKTAELREKNAAALAACSRLEAELKEKRRQVKILDEEAHTTMESNVDDAELHAKMTDLRKQWNRRELGYRDALRHEQLRKQGLETHMSILSNQVQQIPPAILAAYTSGNGQAGMAGGMPVAGGITGPLPGMIPGAMPGSMLGTMAASVAGPSVTASSTSLPNGFEFDPSALHTHARHQSHASSSFASASPLPSLTVTEPNGLVPSPTPPIANISRPPTQAGFLTGPFMGNTTDSPSPDEASLRMLTAGAPLSPSASSLLPSALFSDDDPPSPSPNSQSQVPFSSLGTGPSDIFSNLDSNTVDSNSSISLSNSNPADAIPGTAIGAEGSATTGSGKEPQSPTISSPSASLLSSPRSSSQNLPFPAYNVDVVDGISQRSGLPSLMGDTTALASETANSRGFNALFSRTRTRGAKTLEDGGPLLGSLKHGQSQSFPRQGDDIDGTKSRRMSLSTFNVFNRNSAGFEGLSSLQLSTVNGVNRAGVFSARSFFPFGSRPSAGAFASHVPSSPRPSSMASVDLPRPSTDSGSIWGPPGDNGTAPSGLSKASRLWSTDAAWPSRNPSRRPSIHGSPSVLKTNLASADDEILDEEELLNPETSPSQVGVIGSRPPAAAKKVSSLGKTLNPAAPTFMGSLFRAKADKDKDGDQEKARGKDKGKNKSKGRDKDKDRLCERERRETTGLQTATGQLLPNLTVEDSPTNARKSRDGFSTHTQTSVSESRESLDYVVSNTTSEPTSSVMLSSSKDSDHTLLKLFRKESTSKLSFSRRIGRNRGTGSMASSDKNMSAEQSSIGDVDDAADDSLMFMSGGGRGLGAGPTTSSSAGSNVGGVGGSESITSSPLLGPSKSRDKVESKLKPWFSIKKKNRERPSIEMDREHKGSVGGLGEPDSTVPSLATLASMTEGSETKA